MVKCVFCGREEHSFVGIHVIKNDGNVNYYCCKKCRKNAEKLKRDKRNLKWTAAYREEAKKAVVKEKKKVEADKIKKESN